LEKSKYAAILIACLYQPPEPPVPSLQQLRYLVAVADMLHFRRAAEAVNVTQPTLSSQLRELELRLGVQLVERTRSRVVMTPVGTEIAARARRVLAEVGAIRDLARGAQRPLAGTIRVGVVQTLGPYLLPLVIPDLHEGLPDLRLYLREGLADPLIRRLEDGTIDLLFCPLPLVRADLVTVPLFREPLMVVLPRDHPLAAAGAVPRAALRGQTILTLEPGHRLYEQVCALADEFEAAVSRDYEGTSLDTLRQMVAMGLGLSLLPALYVRSEVARETLVVARPIAEAPPSRVIGMVWRRESSRDAEFRDLSQIVAGILTGRAPELTVL
jgi:LysR family transcriptional regulator, hydrogen peroxide-inducible genes activator